MGSHSVSCNPAATFPTLPQQKLVLDLATPDGCKAELTWVNYPKIIYPPKMVTYLRNNWAVSWLGIEPTTKNSESDVTDSCFQALYMNKLLYFYLFIWFYPFIYHLHLLQHLQSHIFYAFCASLQATSTLSNNLKQQYYKVVDEK